MAAKGAKRSVNMWTTNFYTSLFKNILFYMSIWLLKIRSVHTYVMTRTVYFDLICIYLSCNLWGHFFTHSREIKKKSHIIWAEKVSLKLFYSFYTVGNSIIHSASWKVAWFRHVTVFSSHNLTWGWANNNILYRGLIIGQKLWNIYFDHDFLDYFTDLLAKNKGQFSTIGNLN